MTTLELDDRRRAPLAKIARPEDSTFLVEVLPDGRIVLTPAVTVSKSQVVLNSRADVLDAIDRSYGGDTMVGARPAPRRSAAPRDTLSPERKPSSFTKTRAVTYG